MSDKPNNSGGESGNTILELYKFYVEIADRVNQRREASNRLFAGLLVAVVTAIFLMFRFGGADVRFGKIESQSGEISVVASDVAPGDGQVNGGAPSDDKTDGNASGDKKTAQDTTTLVLTILLLVGGGGIGLCLCFAWMSIIHFYCERSVKISEALEKLGGGISLGQEPWSRIRPEGVSSDHYTITKVERMVPGAFMFIFILMLLFGLAGGGIAAYQKGFFGELILTLVGAAFITKVVMDMSTDKKK